MEHGKNMLLLMEHYLLNFMFNSYKTFCNLLTLDFIEILMINKPILILHNIYMKLNKCSNVTFNLKLKMMNKTYGKEMLL